MVPPPSTKTVEPLANGVIAKKTLHSPCLHSPCLRAAPTRPAGRFFAALPNMVARSPSDIPDHVGIAVNPGDKTFTRIGANSRKLGIRRTIMVLRFAALPVGALTCAN